MIVYGVFEFFTEGSSLEGLFLKEEDAINYANELGERNKKEDDEHIYEGYGIGIENSFIWEKIKEGYWKTKSGLNSIYVKELEVK